MAQRNFFKGPRFALRAPEKTTMACIKCIYGNGEHQPWCEVGKREEAERAETPVQRETEETPAA